MKARNFDAQQREIAFTLFEKARTTVHAPLAISLYRSAYTKNLSVHELTDDDFYFLMRCENNLGLCYDKLQEPTLAIEAFFNAISQWKSIQQPTHEHYQSVVLVYLNLNSRLEEQGKKEDYETFVEQMEAYSLDALQSLAPHFNKPNHTASDNEKLLLARLHLYLVTYGNSRQYNEIEEYEKALNLLNAIHTTHPEQTQIIYMKAHCHHSLAILCQTKHAARKSTSHLNEALMLYRQCPPSDQILHQLRQINSQLNQIRCESETNYYLKGYTLFDAPVTAEEKEQCSQQHLQRYSEF